MNMDIEIIKNIKKFLKPKNIEERRKEYQKVVEKAKQQYEKEINQKVNYTGSLNDSEYMIYYTSENDLFIPEGTIYINAIDPILCEFLNNEDMND